MTDRRNFLKMLPALFVIPALVNTPNNEYRELLMRYKGMGMFEYKPRNIRQQLTVNELIRLVESLPHPYQLRRRSYNP